MDTSKQESISSSSITELLSAVGKNTESPSSSNDFQPGHLIAKRYRVVRRIGRGGFGNVYLARDLELDREVAIKRHREVKSKHTEILRQEAKRIAAMDHPTIVSIYDLLDDPTDGLLVIMQYVNGQTFADFRRHRKPTNNIVRNVFQQVCLALDHAHCRGVIHRDIKPSNLLMDVDLRIYLSDFGLAVSTVDFSADGINGTPGYMAPEQARGESHRIDRRTDIWALGVILYEIFVGVMPFTASSKKEVLYRTLHDEPAAPRLLSPDISPPLESVITRCLRKKSSERFSSARELFEELSACPEMQVSSVSDQSNIGATKAQGQNVATPSTHPSSQLPEIVPKGFRAFDEDDAEFYLQLVPGPRDRFGIPDSVRFWKSFIESDDPSKTAPVGVLYGPSGSGKSSLVRAGICPRLDPDIAVVHIECRPGDLIARIIASVAKRCSLPAKKQRLSYLLGQLRQDESASCGFRKILIVLDQFESWSHAATLDERRDLADALRQCDGEHVQALIVVRDDFWMGVTELMHWLDIPLVESFNIASVELLDRRLAERILVSVGRAYGALPMQPEALTAEEKSFVTEAVQQLSQDDRVICVHLTMFANMMRLQKWTPELLQECGGVHGACMRYFRELFESRHSPPSYRRCLSAAVVILEALLPSVSNQVRTKSCSVDDFSKLLGSEGGVKLLGETLRILTDELRFISVVRAESDGDSNSDAELRYQLAHDFLIVPLRQWIEPIRKSTWRGRAVARLNELSDLWSRRPHPRFLPTTSEFLAMHVSVSEHALSDQQKKFLHAARRFHAGRASVVAVTLLLAAALAVLAFEQNRKAVAADESRIAAKLDLFFHGPVDQVPRLIKELTNDPRTLSSKLPNWTDSIQDSVKMRARLLAATIEESKSLALLDGIDNVEPELFENILSVLQKTSSAKSELERIAADETNVRKALRAAVLSAHLGNKAPLNNLIKSCDAKNGLQEVIPEAIVWRGEPKDWIPLLGDGNDAIARYFAFSVIGSFPSDSVKQLDISAPLDAALTSTEPILVSVAQWLVTRHQLDKPITAKPPAGSDWQISSHGLTLVRMKPDSKNYEANNKAVSNSILAAIEKPIWISQTPITVKLYSEFLAEVKSYSDGTALGERSIRKKNDDPNLDNPEIPVTGFEVGEAVEFCNWLSRKEGFTECYKFSKMGVFNITETDSAPFAMFDRVPDASGYRMLEPAEYAYCLAGGQSSGRPWESATTLETKLVGKKNNFYRPVRGMLPNRLGIFLTDENLGLMTIGPTSRPVNVLNAAQGIWSFESIPGNRSTINTFLVARPDTN